MVYQSIQKKENENMCLKNRLLQLTLVVLSLAIGMQAQDRANCSNATLHGSYGLRATGRTLAGGDIVVLGRFTYDGNGNLTADCSIDSPTPLMKRSPLRGPIL